MHRCPRRTREGLRELRQVAERAVDAKLRWGVRIDGEPALRLFLAILAAPGLTDREEELLILGEAIGHDLPRRIFT